MNVVHVIVSSTDLLRELAVLARLVQKKPTLPILSNVLLQAADGWLHMSVTDLEVGMVTACQATVGEAGDLTLPVAKLAELAKTLPNTDITISSVKGVVKFTAAGFNSRLQSLPAADFPAIPVPEGTSVILPRGPFRDLIKKVRFAINEGDSRHLVRGALLTLPENAFGLVATDSHRLALAPAVRVGAVGDPALLPAKALDHLTILLSDSGEGDLTFSRTDRHLFFELDGRVLVSRRIEGKFPSYERIIPTSNDHVVLLDRSAFATMVKRQLLIADIVTLTIDAGAVDITTSSAEVGDAIERLPVTYEGPKLEIKLNGGYVVEFLEAATGQQVQMALKDAKSPALFTDDQYINVMMGMRT